MINSQHHCQPKDERQKEQMRPQKTLNFMYMALLKILENPFERCMIVTRKHIDTILSEPLHLSLRTSDPRAQGTICTFSKCITYIWPIVHVRDTKTLSVPGIQLSPRKSIAVIYHCMQTSRSLNYYAMPLTYD